MTDLQTIAAIKRLQQESERLRKPDYSPGIPWYARGRPTLTSGTPVTTADVTGSDIYWTPGLNGWFDEISLDINPSTTGDITLGSAVVSNVSGGTSQLAVGMTVTGVGIPLATTILTIDSSSQITMSANATATTIGVAITFGVATDINMDLRLDVQNFELSPLLWSTHGAGTSTRATAVSYDRGIPYLASTQYKLLGTFRTSAADTIADTIINRFVSSVYNPVWRWLFANPGYNNNNSNDSYTHNSANYSQLNGGVDTRVEFVLPFDSSEIDAKMIVNYALNNAVLIEAGIGENITTGVEYVEAAIGSGITSIVGAFTSTLPKTISEGYNFLDMLARTSGTASILPDRARNGSAADPRATRLEVSLKM